MAGVVEALILGIVQGITEWLPVSSSGHLVILQHAFGLSQEIALDLALHLGTLSVVVFVLRRELGDIAVALFRSTKNAFHGRSLCFYWSDEKIRLAVLVAIGSIPAGLAGFFLQDFVEQAFESLAIVGLGLLFTGTLLWLARQRPKRNTIGWKDALFIGTMQAVSIIPGISRSGSTISTALFRKIDRDLAARYSFLLFIPAIMGAAFLERGQIAGAELLPIAAGIAAAVISGYFTINFLLRIVRSGRLHYFSWYCWALGLAVLFAS